MLCLGQRVASQWLIVTHCDVVLLGMGSALVYVTSLAWQMWDSRVSMVGHHVAGTGHEGYAALFPKPILIKPLVEAT